MNLHAILKFLQFEFLVEKADIVEGFESLLELTGVVFDEFFKGLIAVYEFEEGMIHDEVIETDLLLKFLLLGLCDRLLEICLI